jgi:CspA family cold shock protein
MMLSGTVKRIHSERGFGFITADDGTDFFFHRSGLDWSLDFEDLRAGERVTFDVEPSAKGPRAGRVRGLSSR